MKLVVNWWTVDDVKKRCSVGFQHSMPAQCICSVLSNAPLGVNQQFNCPFVNREVGITPVSIISRAVLSEQQKHMVCAVCAVLATSALNSVPVRISTVSCVALV